MEPDSTSEIWQFELYIIGDNRRSALAMDNLQGICNDYLCGQCHVDVFDIKEHPELAAKKQITAGPILVKKYPLPEKTLVGDLSFTDKVLEGLDIGQAKKPDIGNMYRDGLDKQGLYFKLHHELHQR